MPRGKRKTQAELLDEQLAKVETELGTCRAKIKDLESKKQELTELKKREALDALYSKIQASGKTVEEILKAMG